MGQIVTDCPRCGAARTTLDVFAVTPLPRDYEWQAKWEAFVACRHCARSSILLLSLRAGVNVKADAATDPVRSQAGLSDYYAVVGYIGIKDEATGAPPEYLPADIAAAFREGATCIAVECWNAGGTMFRLCLDLATRTLLPGGERPGLNWRTRRDLGLRLPWLFDNHHLPADLRELSTCVQQDGNDGAHAGTLTEPEALDLQDFTVALLERLYTEPERLRLAAERRNARRQQ
jgi:hypothetical protein